ncbi:regulatory iron-sulfur-containing complex subunit RicT [Pseudopedobacter sp.]|uniref:PSP1 domain-containing protein n=1 Tax=Pseudopedobacter sp. TaxID=1936787 RepID=UPI00333FD0DB
MGCGSCSSGGGCTPAGCKSNGSCMTDGGCSKLDVYDWLSDMDSPANYKPFPFVEIRFKGSRKDFYRNVDNIYLEAGELVVVETTGGGYDVGHVTLTGELVRVQMNRKKVTEEKAPLKIFRKATVQDVEKWKSAKEREYETMHKARTIALELGLEMKLSDVEYQGDKTKATFFYTAEGRVDFRELIKKLAEAFRVRIEMRQIGMRQEASRLGGIGSCGRELCCSTWLTDFKTVSTAAARYQNLSLNTLKLAGQCGKLKCCLNYELDSYMDALKHIPDNADLLKTSKGDAKLQKTDIFKKVMWFSYFGEDNTWIPLQIDRVREILALNKQGQMPEELKDFESFEEEIVIEKSFDYENVVGQDSLTRLDEKARRKKKKNKSGNGINNNNGANKNVKPGNNNQPAQQQNKKAPQQNNNQQSRGNTPDREKKQNNSASAETGTVVNKEQNGEQKHKKRFKKRKPNNNNKKPDQQ